MNKLGDLSRVRYAVIEGLRTETGHERIVIAYPTEQSLRDLISAPSIVAFGFSSREEAVANTRPCVPSAADYQRVPQVMASRETGRHQQRLSWIGLRGQTGSALRKLGGFLITACSNVVTSTIVLFSSSNTISAVFRMALGSSV